MAMATAMAKKSHGHVGGSSEGVCFTFVTNTKGLMMATIATKKKEI